MIKRLARFVPLLLALAWLWGGLFSTLQASIAANQGRLVYALDDAYIHMAMAKNMARHGVWGVTRHGFSSTSSSLLWTLALSAAYALFGAGEAVPFIFNFFLATVLILTLFYVLNRLRVRPGPATLWLLVFVGAVPWVYLTFGGLEHVLHHLATLLYGAAAAAVLCDEKGASRPVRAALMGLAAVLVLTRFEGIFPVLVVTGLLLLRRRLGQAIGNLVAGGMPLLVYGLISLANGWYFLPSSVLLKGHRPDLSTLKGMLGFVYAGLRQLVYNIHILVVVLAVLFLIWRTLGRERSFWRPGVVLGALFLATVLLHMFFARSGFYLNRVSQIRYDAYLITLGLFAVLHLLARRSDGPAPPGRHAWLVAGLGILVLLPLAEWGLQADRQVVVATRNIHDQQYQMGRFLARYYPQESVVANDIGAINFLADIRCFDIWGLASRDIADAVLARTYSSREISRLAADAGAVIAVVYDYPFHFKTMGGIPPGWTRVAAWTIADNVVCAADTVSFYALNRSEIPRLLAALARFSAELPPGVRERGHHLRLREGG